MPKIQKSNKEKIDIGSVTNQLSEISDRLKEITDTNEKIQILINLNEFIEKNKEIIKNNCPDKLISILNSL